MNNISNEIIMKKLFLLLMAIAGLSWVFHQSLAAQENQVTGKVFYVELFGPGLLMSANFDSRFKSNERLGFGYRIGVGFSVVSIEDGLFEKWGYYDDDTRSYYSIPAGLNYIFGKPNSANTFEVGGGISFLTHKTTLYCYDDNSTGRLIGYFSFTYRMTPVNGGFSFRIGFTPIIGTSGNLFPMGAIGFGYAF